MNAMTANKKILIADDDNSIRLVLSQAFTRLGYQVRATGNCQLGLRGATHADEKLGHAGFRATVKLSAWPRAGARSGG